jgi:hypothetical protein
LKRVSELADELLLVMLTVWKLAATTVRLEATEVKLSVAEVASLVGTLNDNVPVFKSEIKILLPVGEVCTSIELDEVTKGDTMLPIEEAVLKDRFGA